MDRARSDQGLAEPVVYALDIETDTTVDGLDPAVSPIVCVALATPGGDTCFTGDEATVLRAVDDALAALEPGVIATWNGAGFDLPFIATRARFLGVPLGLDLCHDPVLHLSRPPLAGHPGAYRARWGAHRHLDVYRVYRLDVGPALGISCALKSIARLVGLHPVEVDRERIHELSADELAAYACSDAHLTRELTERRRGSALRATDRIPSPDHC